MYRQSFVDINSLSACQWRLDCCILYGSWRDTADKGSTFRGCWTDRDTHFKKSMNAHTWSCFNKPHHFFCLCQDTPRHYSLKAVMGFQISLRKCCRIPRPAIGGMGGDECSDFKNPILRTFLCGNRIFAETEKSRLCVKPRPVGGELHSFRFKGLFGQIRHPIIGSKDPNLHSQLLFDKVTSLVNDLIRDMAFTRIQVYIFHVFIQFPQRPPSQKSVEYPENNWDTSSSLYLVVSISTILKDAFFWATFKVFLNFWSNSWSDSSCSWRWSQ